MFISKAEKRNILFSIEILEGKVADLTRKLAYINYPFTPTGPVKLPRKGRSWSPEQRAEAAERMKKQQADKKAKAQA